MPKPSELVVTASKADASGKRLVVVMFGSRQHRDQFDPDAGYQRRQWREAVIRSLRVEPEIYNATGSAESTEAHLFNAIDDRLYAAVEAADAEPQSALWQPEVTTMADVEHATTQWLWDQHIPLGAISNLSGDPGLGKSQLTCDLGARISRGWPMPPLSAPDGTFKPRGVLFMNAEDDPARTLRPRLEAAGADLRRVHCLRSMKCSLEDEEERPVALPSDLASIEQVIRRGDVALVVIDPFVAFLDGKLNINNDGDVRRCLGQVSSLAEATGAAFLLVRHLNKKSGLSAVYRGGGSIGVTGAARAEFMVGVDPADPEARILACVKSNLAPEPSSLRFHIESHESTSRVRWGDHCDTSAHDLCAGSSDNRRGGKSEAAKELLQTILADGSRGSNEIEIAMEEAGISKSTYWRARRELGVEAEKSGFNDGQWLLSLPIVNGFNHAEF